jgi:methionyl-tRNA formyltransferase
VVRATAGTGRPDVPPGTLVDAEATAGDGLAVRLITVQPEGRQPMDVADWLRGARPAPGERLGR